MSKTKETCVNYLRKMYEKSAQNILLDLVCWQHLLNISTDKEEKTTIKKRINTLNEWIFENKMILSKLNNE